MTRKKVTLAYITNDSERRTSFRKRKNGLIKKVSELSTLCDVEACAIIYSPFEPEPEVWPSQAGAEAVLDRFRRMSELDKSKKMVNQESFTRQRIKKTNDQLRRLQKENRRRDMESFMYQCLAGIASLDHFDLRNSAEMGWVIDQALRDIESIMDKIDVVQDAPLPTPPPPPPPPPTVEMEVEEVVPMTGGKNGEGYLLNHLVQSANGLSGSGFEWDFGW